MPQGLSILCGMRARGNREAWFRFRRGPLGYEFNVPTTILGSTSVSRTSKRKVAVVWRPAWASNTKCDFEIHGRSWQLLCKVATCSCWHRRFPCFAFCKTCHAQGKEAQKEQESSSSTRRPRQNMFERGLKVRQTFVARSKKLTAP